MILSLVSSDWTGLPIREREGDVASKESDGLRVERKRGKEGRTRAHEN